MGQLFMMTMRTRSQFQNSGRASHGFSLVELVIVTAAVAIATAMAVPVIVNANNTYQLRNATVELASMLQRSRLYCIQNNKYTAIQTNSAAINTSPIGAVVFLDVNSVGSGGTPTAAYPQVTLPANITQTNASAPSISSSTLGFSSAQAPPAYFNGRGLPCTVVSGVCTNWSTANTAPVGYIYYLKQVSNGTRWSAVSITPGGQIKTWMYNGSTWTNR